MTKEEDDQERDDLQERYKSNDQKEKDFERETSQNTTRPPKEKENKKERGKGVPIKEVPGDLGWSSALGIRDGLQKLL